MTLFNLRYPIFTILTLFAFVFSSYAMELPELSWSDRVSEEKTDGTIVDTAPFVQIGNIRLSRFAQMQSLELQDTIATGNSDEVLHVFRVWQGGASQGQQLMLVTNSEFGVDVIGPYPQDFETLDIMPTKGDYGPIFELYGENTINPIERLEYFDGQLIQLSAN